MAVIAWYRKCLSVAHKW